MDTIEASAADWFLRAEDEIKTTEAATGTLTVPAISELRYAGLHFALATRSSDAETQASEVQKAKVHCERAFRDAIEDRALLALSWFSVPRETSPEAERAMVEGARQIAAMVRQNAHGRSTGDPFAFRDETDRLLAALESSGIPKPALAARAPLRVFLCHGLEDKVRVRELYDDLGRSGHAPWLDERDLLPGQDWRAEIDRAVRESDVVIVCLSKTSVPKRGYVQKEIVRALDVAEQQPEGAIYLVPARLDECVVPDRLSRWQWVDLFTENGPADLARALQAAAIQRAARSVSGARAERVEAVVPYRQRPAIADALRKWLRR